MSTTPHPTQRHNVALTILVSLAGFLLFGGLAWWMLQMAGKFDTYEQTRAIERKAAFDKLTAEDASILSSYAWVDANAKIVRIPIDVAMQVTVNRLKNRPVTAAGPVPDPLPKGLTPPTPQSPSAQ
jgi:hypothetical protein